ncbi:pseudouridine synthase PUS5 TDEL_0F05040 [Torulaspora delbrueckii]|uniref:21S rRNA pseudouridine(2819) synthase n=1 Tax=Torulaspora delbrueckii TaxID=4950 RepID=G8ZXH1_TORDE|nr:hypothetical protein TDEL_0F05040 [Torulaspora delbrueckii]CCE93315.1 hypothetical protein TDEL_0F05040 [Torulaspora delbrueckii]
MSIGSRTLPVVCECSNYFIVNKPYGMFSQPGDLGQKYAHYPVKAKPPVVLDELRRQYGKGRVDAGEWRTVHRLDACVTGGMLLVKNKNAAIQFSKNLRAGGNKGFKMTRRYVAIVGEGEIGTKYRSDTGVIQCLGMTTRYRRFDEKCYVLELISGGKHQIRRHLAQGVGQPILNDEKFQGSLVPGTNPAQIALHSACIKTTVGFQKRSHLIPMVYNNDGKLWDPKYVDREGNFNLELQRMLLNDWTDIVF